MKRVASVKLPVGFFRFSDLLTRQYQTDYYPSVPYGERSIALALKYEETHMGIQPKIGITGLPRSGKSAVLDKVVSMVAAGLFVIIVLAAIATEWDTLMNNIGKLGPAVMLLCVVMLGIGYKSAEFLELNSKRATTVSIESGIQNAVVGIAVGDLILADPAGGFSTLSLPSGVYGVLMYIVISPFIYWRITKSED